jgi:hypothetical protein
MMLRVVVLFAAPLLLALPGCPSPPSSPSSPQAGPTAGAPAAGSSSPGDDRRTAITITTTPPGATVVVDGAPVGASPVTVPLTPGPHRLRATMSGYYPAPETRIVVERGVVATHSLALVASH